MPQNAAVERESGLQMWDNGPTKQDGPGSAPTLLIRGLADEWSVD